jgi:hypothetical protein
MGMVSMNCLPPTNPAHLPHYPDTHLYENIFKYYLEKLAVIPLAASRHRNGIGICPTKERHADQQITANTPL